MSYTGKKILITGGTGAIGQCLVHNLLREETELIRIYSRDEYKQYMQQDALSKYDNIQFVIGDVRDYASLYSAMEGIDYVFHLAAMKHVPACESYPYEAVQTNVKGTYHVIQAAKAQQVKKVLLSSSDKAVLPTNTYGATKLMAERIIQATEKDSNDLVVSAVRFGNVIGSRGSVIPLFQRQILKRQAITVTDLKMTRFMMTKDQAVSLMMKAMNRSIGGEIFVLKMPVIQLKDLAEVVIDSTCKRNKINQDNIKIEEIGLRPGEKRYEELMTYDESLKAYDLGDMYMISNRMQDWPNAEVGTYSSNIPTPNTKEEIVKLLQSAQVLEG
ncbi:FlaA1/EpsC-like NDP-sugar epimerase [Alkalibacillus filiformis]|uniref:FlaA1/EpsC-like NDP-sugar epimerase n=1 Tax=Alkalibacillus filiformis TaxID=200990 RepID=A0ABU0DP74_9BACI|nr:SDR family NAD(P)-dependent oxidoreductase [Alkalibacillus filiformis]MDQ0350234.1 FlaA1/EpsC-like NDP-sugar epimerase [Alkalibacillus filiformis]